MEEPPSPLLSANEVAKLLNIKKSTVYDAVEKGRLPAVSLWKGKRRTFLRFRRSDIEAFIRERSAPAKTSVGDKQYGR